MLPGHLPQLSAAPGETASLARGHRRRHLLNKNGALAAITVITLNTYAHFSQI